MPHTVNWNGSQDPARAPMPGRQRQTETELPANRHFLRAKRQTESCFDDLIRAGSLGKSRARYPFPWIFYGLMYPAEQKGHRGGVTKRIYPDSALNGKEFTGQSLPFLTARRPLERGERPSPPALQARKGVRVIAIFGTHPSDSSLAASDHHRRCTSPVSSCGKNQGRV